MSTKQKEHKAIEAAEPNVFDLDTLEEPLNVNVNSEQFQTLAVE